MKQTVALWLSWTFFTAIGSMLGFAISWILGPLFSWDEYGVFFALANITIVGFLVSFGQWIILRKVFKKAWVWILITTFCLPIGIFIGFLGIAVNIPSFGNFLDAVHDYIISGCCAGLIIGMLQWLSLRANRFGGMFAWILVSGLSWGIGIALPMFIFNTYMSNESSAPLPWQWSNFGLFIGAIVGAITGIFVKPCILDQSRLG